MKRVILYFNLYFISLLPLLAQTGAGDNFNDNSLLSGWKTSVSTVTLTEANAELNVNIASISNYDNVSFDFSPVDISANPILTFKIKSPKAFTLRVDLVDDQGNSTNTAATTQAITSNANYSNISLNFSGKFNQSYPTATVVNNKKIAKIVFFFNAGSTFSGNLYLDDVVLGTLTTGVVSGPFTGTVRKNQIGYETSATKVALIESAVNTIAYSKFTLTNSTDTITRFRGNVGAWKQVAGWKNRYFSTLDFSTFKTPGTYKLLIDGKTVTGNIVIGDAILFKQTSASVISFFKGMRSLLTSDNSISFNGPRNDFVDLHGGWFDATGDAGKHLSHLSYANYFNPQQIPMVAWGMMKSYEMDTTAFAGIKTQVKDEIVWGADYLVRSLDNLGYFYLSVFDTWGAAGAVREICEWSGSGGTRSANYQSAMREGAGISIAALAKAYTMKFKGTYTSQQYLDAAIKGYAHLKSAGTGYNTKNLEYGNDHTENIIDDYCGLLAAVELYKATKTASYLQDANSYYQSLIAKQQASGWFASDLAGNRPFYHAADEGLPIVAIVEYAKIAPSQATSIKDVLTKWNNWYIAISKEVENPFSYVREYFKPYTTSLQTAKKSFFLPHNNETGYWWQGENARLASMTTAFLSSSRLINPNFNLGNDSISQFAVSQLDWIVGKNPYGICMVTGFGDANYAGYTGKTNIKGGICNGISSDTLAETDLMFMPYPATDWQNWRWIEQWLPHDTWFLLATTTLGYYANHPVTLVNDCNGVLGGSAFIDSCKNCAGGNTGVTPVLNSKFCVTGIDVDNYSKVSLYPNPTSGVLKIGIDDFVQVEVYNSLGTLVLTSNSDILQLGAFSNGIYVLKINSLNGTQFEKALKIGE